LKILRQVSESTWDVHTVSLFPADEPAGMIAIEDGVTAYDSLRGLIIAAAYPVFAQQQRAVQPARKPQGLTEFMRSVRVGSATAGSYVLTAHTPVPPRLSGQPSLFDDLASGLPAEEPLERQVSLRLYQAVQAAHEAADAALLTADGLEPFTAAVSRGVSANLCEALIGFGGNAGHPFQLSISLAATRQNTAVLVPVRFRRDHLPVLKEVATEFRARTPEEDIAVTGEVVRLHREGSVHRRDHARWSQRGFRGVATDLDGSANLGLRGGDARTSGNAPGDGPRQPDPPGVPASTFPARPGSAS
jgi:hypothetical protein